MVALLKKTKRVVAAAFVATATTAEFLQDAFFI
jgi:hypothetical protein